MDNYDVSILVFLLTALVWLVAYFVEENLTCVVLSFLCIILASLAKIAQMIDSLK